MGENISWNRIHCVLIQPEFYEYLQIRDKTPLLFNLMFKDLTITVFVVCVLLNQLILYLVFQMVLMRIIFPKSLKRKFVN